MFSLDKMSSIMIPVPSIIISLISVIVIIWLLIVYIYKVILSPFLRHFTSEPTPLVVRTPENLFAGLDTFGYNFAPNYFHFSLGGGVKSPRIHYVDEGNKDSRKTILCLHGEPSWSFLYRKMIPNFVSAGYRVIALDFIGFGKSDKYTSPDNYTHELHAATVRHLIDELHLKDIVLVCQDWGGLIGLSVVKDMPDHFSDIVVMNTGLPIGGLAQTLEEEPVWKQVIKAVPFLFWKTLATVAGTYIPVKYIFQYLEGMEPEVAECYDLPFPDHRFKGGVAQFPSLVPLFPDDPVAPHMVEARNFLRTSWRKPMLVMFSTGDPITRGIGKLFTKLVPSAKEIKIRGAKHFLQETHGEELAENILRFLENQ